MRKTKLEDNVKLRHRRLYRQRLLRRKNHFLPGSLLLEAVIAIGMFAIFLGGIGFSLVLGERSTVAGGDRARAVAIAAQQLEAVREMRNRDFSLLTTGTHGMALTATGWSFLGTSVTKNGYRSNVTVTQHGADWVDVDSNVSWNFQNTRSGSISFQTSVTNWRKTVTIGDWAAMTRIATITESGTPDFRKIAVSGDYAFVTGAEGVFIYDVSVPSSPVRTNASFTLGAGAFGLVANGNRLYVVTDNPSQELQVYDISSAATLTAGNLVNTMDIPGIAVARSVAVYGNTVYVGTLDDPPNPQFYSILMSETGPMTIQDSLSLSGSVLDISLHEGYAYTATSYNAGELQVIDVFDPAAITFAPGAGIDLTEVQDGSAVATFGTSALLGRLDGSTIDELSLWPIADAPVPVTPPGPWTLEIGGDLNALETIAGSKYAFAGGSASANQIRVLDIIKFALGQSPIVKTYNAQATIFGLFYDWQHDRLYAVSADALFVFAPG